MTIYTAAEFNNQDLYKIYDAIVNGGGGVSGSGTLNYVSKWTPDGATIGNSQIYDNGTSVGVGTTTLTYYFNVLKNQNANTTVSVSNTNAGNASRSGFLATSEDNSLAAYAYSSTFANTYFQNNAVVYSAKRVLRFIADADGAGSGKITWGIGSGTSTNELLTLLSTGEFGVGQTTPTAQLHVTATAKIAAKIVGASTYNTLEVTGGGSTSSTYAAKFANSASTVLANIRDDGKFFIGAEPGGTYDSTDKLIVSGNIVCRSGHQAFYMYNDGTYQIIANYNYNTASYNKYTLGHSSSYINMTGTLSFTNTHTNTDTNACVIESSGNKGALLISGGNHATNNGIYFYKSDKATLNVRFKDDGGVYMPLLQIGNLGLSIGDLYKDTAANILANGDYVIGMKA